MGYIFEEGNSFLRCCVRKCFDSSLYVAEEVCNELDIHYLEKSKLVSGKQVFE